MTYAPSRGKRERVNQMRKGGREGGREPQLYIQE